MAKVMVDELVLIELAVKFEHVRALFDVIEDEVPHEERAYSLANLGMRLAFDAARKVEDLHQNAERRPMCGKCDANGICKYRRISDAEQSSRGDA